MTAPAQISDPLVGSRIDGRYLVLGLLGRGGMGVVYDGLHEQLGRPVAIKVLGVGTTDPAAIERFLREARTASSLTHGNIVDVTDLGELPDGRPYLVMPKMNGQDLLTLLREHGPQSPARVVALLRGAASALDVIHAKGFVHRDVKPENLMHVVHDDGSESVRLLDFGIVALTSKQDQRLTADGVVFGTPIYLAPELMESEDPDARTDVYSLAVVAFELLTGRAPFEANTSMRIMQMKATKEPPRMQSVSGLPFSELLEQVVARGLARDPKQRFVSAGEFVRALDAAARGDATALAAPSEPGVGGSALSARPAAPPARGAASVLLSEAKTERATITERLARRRGLVLAACVGPLVGAALAWSLPDGEAAPRPNPTPALPRAEAAPRPELPLEPTPAKPAPADPAPTMRVAEPAPSEHVIDLPVEARAEREDAGGRADRRGNSRPKAPSPPTTSPSPSRVGSSGSASGGELVKAAAQALILGQLDAADRLYHDATRKEPGNVAAWRGLGLTSERLGRREAAISAFQRALQLAPSGAQADSIRARLSKLTAAR